MVDRICTGFFNNPFPSIFSIPFDISPGLVVRVKTDDAVTVSEKRMTMMSAFLIALSSRSTIKRAKKEERRTVLFSPLRMYFNGTRVRRAVTVIERKAKAKKERDEK